MLTIEGAPGEDTDCTMWMCRLLRDIAGCACLKIRFLLLWLICFHIATDKALYFIRKLLISFLFLRENICCGYSLEAPRRGASNEYPQHMFFREIRKILCGYPLLSEAMFSLPQNEDRYMYSQPSLLGCLGVAKVSGYLTSPGRPTDIGFQLG